MPRVSQRLVAHFASFPKALLPVVYVQVPVQYLNRANRAQ